ncbi:MAG: type II secretion system protein J [Gemmatimonadaceae bacterium]
MSSVNRRGVTLVELLASLALFGVIAAAALSTLATNQRMQSALRQHTDLQQNIRAAANLFPAELRELDAVDGDISAISASSITIRAMRRLGFACDPPPLGASLDNLGMTIRAHPYFGTRDFRTGDSLLVFYEGNPDARTDDSWARGVVIATSSESCPDGAAGRRLVVGLTLSAAQPNSPGAIARGAPVRGFEPVTYHAYSAADGKWYLGLRTGSGLQPVVGPLTGGDGLRLDYYDRDGAVTDAPASVALVEIRLRATTAKPTHRSGSTPGVLVDSVATTVALRNNRRF